MKQIILLVFTAFSSYLSAQSIVGGSGNCMINGNPNSVLNLQTINQKFNCASVIDTTTGDQWIYKVSLVQGSRWENRTQIVKDSINSINTRLGVLPTKPYVDSSVATKWTIGGNILNADGIIGTTSPFNVIFKTNNIERARLLATGQFGLTTNNSIGNYLYMSDGTTRGFVGYGATMHSSFSNTDFGLRSQAGLILSKNGGFVSQYFPASGGIAFLGNGSLLPDASNAQMFLNSVGNLGIGTNIPTNKLHVVGTNPIRAEGLQTGTSTDQLVTVDATGVFKQRTVSDVTNYSSYAAISSSTTYTSTSPNVTKTTGTITVTLPTASSASNKSFTFVKSDISTVLTIQANGSETINNANFITSNSQWDRITLFSTSTEWLVIGQ